MEKTVNLEELKRRLIFIEKNMITKNELDSAMESIMIYSNEDTMRQIKGSEEDIINGRVKCVSSVNDI